MPENSSDGKWSGNSVVGMLSKMGANRRDPHKSLLTHLPSESTSQLCGCFLFELDHTFIQTLAYYGYFCVCYQQDDIENIKKELIVEYCQK